MTFNPIAALNAVECKKIIEKDNPNALDLGSQTPTLDNVFLKSLKRSRLFLLWSFSS